LRAWVLQSENSVLQLSLLASSSQSSVWVLRFRDSSSSRKHKTSGGLVTTAASLRNLVTVKQSLLRNIMQHTSLNGVASFSSLCSCKSEARSTLALILNFSDDVPLAPVHVLIVFFELWNNSIVAECTINTLGLVVLGTDLDTLWSLWTLRFIESSVKLELVQRVIKASAVTCQEEESFFANTASAIEIQALLTIWITLFTNVETIVVCALWAWFITNATFALEDQICAIASAAAFFFVEIVFWTAFSAEFSIRASSALHWTVATTMVVWIRSVFELIRQTFALLGVIVQRECINAISAQAISIILSTRTVLRHINTLASSVLKLTLGTGAFTLGRVVESEGWMAG